MPGMFSKYTVLPYPHICAYGKEIKEKRNQHIESFKYADVKNNHLIDPLLIPSNSTADRTVTITTKSYYMH